MGHVHTWSTLRYIERLVLELSLHDCAFEVSLRYTEEVKYTIVQYFSPLVQQSAGLRCD